MKNLHYNVTRIDEFLVKKSEKMRNPIHVNYELELEIEEDEGSYYVTVNYLEGLIGVLSSFQVVYVVGRSLEEYSLNSMFSFQISVLKESNEITLLDKDLVINNLKGLREMLLQNVTAEQKEDVASAFEYVVEKYEKYLLCDVEQIFSLFSQSEDSFSKELGLMEAEAMRVEVKQSYTNIETVNVSRAAQKLVGPSLKNVINDFESSSLDVDSYEDMHVAYHAWEVEEFSDITYRYTNHYRLNSKVTDKRLYTNIECSDRRYFTWESFRSYFDKEVESADSVYDSMKENGLVEYSLAKFDFHFSSDSKEKLEKLQEFLLDSYPYTVEEIIQDGDEWELSGQTNEMPITNDILLYWALDMYQNGYQFDAVLTGYGAPIDYKAQQIQKFEGFEEEYFFDMAIDNYNSGNASGALINWTLCIEIDPKDVNSYYSRAIVKNELYMRRAALEDYDKAIEIAPDYLSALLNRGGLKDDFGDYEGAIEDYNRIIELNRDDMDNKQKAYFNRGNSKYNMDDEEGACQDWHKAKELGADDVEERINSVCKNGEFQ